MFLQLLHEYPQYLHKNTVTVIHIGSQLLPFLSFCSLSVASFDATGSKLFTSWLRIQ